MTDPFVTAMYGTHVFLSPWDASPVPGGPTYRELAVARMRAEQEPPGSTQHDTSTIEASNGESNG